MPSRFYLPASGAAEVSPTFSAEWEHQQGVRRAMSPTKGSTALASQAYTPDAADDLVNADALHVQFVSAPLSAQTISAQTVALTVQGLMAHANNAQFLTWKLFIWTAAGAVGSTLLAIRRDATAYTTSIIARTDSATTTSVTVGAGDRLVLEVGTGGTPTATGGVQGHNATLRWGETGATDSPANDTSTSATENPWLEFANVLSFVPPPATTGTAGVRARGQVANTARRDAATTLSLWVDPRMAITTTSFHPVTTRRAVVTWAAFSTPAATIPKTTGEVRLSASSRGASTIGPKATRIAADEGRFTFRVVTQASRASTSAARLEMVFMVDAVGRRSTSNIALAQAFSLGSSEGQRGAKGTLVFLVTAKTLAENTTERESVGEIRVALATPLIGVMGTQNAVELHADVSLDLVTTSTHPPPGPFDPLVPVFLGAAYRGDTLLLPLWVARDQRGITLDLTEADIWFTAKTDLEDTDAEVPTIQCTSEAGEIQIMDPPVLGIYQVTIQPNQTHALDDDTVFNFDVQVITDFPRTTTVRVGTFIIVRDITRAMA